MSGQRQPTAVVIANGRKNLTKAEIQERLDREIKPIADNIIAPDYLTKKQQEEFDKIAEQLKRLGIMGETDIDALARFVVANDLYITAVKKLRSKVVKDDPILFDLWARNQERYFKQCRTSANDLGLTISSRCKLVVPATKEPPKKENRFAKFEKRASVNG